MSIEKVRAFFQPLGLAERILEFDVSSATVELAAKALGCEGCRIAKSLSFKLGGKAVLIVAAGDARVDNHRYKARFGAKAAMLTPPEVEAMVGHAVGGVCPFAVNEGVEVYLDESLRRFDTVFPACGSSSSAIELTIPELEQYAKPAGWVDVCKSWRAHEKLPEVQGKLGFGFMRLPMVGEDVDEHQVCQMVDEFLAAGFNYFDTARPYLDGKSELAIRSCLAQRHPREAYLLANKLSGSCFTRQADILPLFEDQLKACGVEYFDVYLMHCQSRRNYQKFQDAHAYDIAAELKAQGKIRHLALSFHDTADILDTILTDHPEIELVQLQFNYLDFQDPAVQAGACYDVCRRHGRAVLVMEPVKGGSLAKLPPAGQKVYAALGDASPASYAIRYAAGFEDVACVLSGMSDLVQLRDNLGFMKDFRPLDPAEEKAVAEVTAILRAQHTIPCTGCRYCVAGCPKGILIPDLFACANTAETAEHWDAAAHYVQLCQTSAKASECLHCGLCEDACPQKLEIRRLLEEIAAKYEG